MYLISVYFDTAATKRIQTLIEQIAAASGNHYMTDKKVPPHLTLSAIEARSVDVLIPSVQQLDGRLRQGTIQFVTTGQFFPMFCTPCLCWTLTCKTLHGRLAMLWLAFLRRLWANTMTPGMAAACHTGKNPVQRTDAAGFFRHPRQIFSLWGTGHSTWTGKGQSTWGCIIF